MEKDTSSLSESVVERTATVKNTEKKMTTMNTQQNIEIVSLKNLIGVSSSKVSVIEKQLKDSEVNGELSNTVTQQQSQKIIQLSQEIEQKKKVLKSHEDKIQQQQEQLQVANKTVKDRDKMIQKLELELCQLKLQNVNNEKTIKCLRECNELERENVEILMQEVKVREKMEVLKSENDKQSTRILELQSALKDKDAVIISMRKEVEDVARSSEEKLAKLAEAMKVEISALKMDLEEKKADVKNKEEKITELANRHDAEIFSLMNLIEEKSALVADIEQKLKVKGERVEQLTGDKEQQSLRMTKLQDELEAIKVENISKERKIQKQYSEHKVANKKVMKVEEKREILTLERGQLIQSILTKEEDLEQVLEPIANMHQDMEKLCEEKAAEIVTLKEKVEKLMKNYLSWDTKNLGLLQNVQNSTKTVVATCSKSISVGVKSESKVVKSTKSESTPEQLDPSKAEPISRNFASPSQSPTVKLVKQEELTKGQPTKRQHDLTHNSCGIVPQKKAKAATVMGSTINSASVDIIKTSMLTPRLKIAKRPCLSMSAIVNSEEPIPSASSPSSIEVIDLTLFEDDLETEVDD